MTLTQTTRGVAGRSAVLQSTLALDAPQAGPADSRAARILSRLALGVAGWLACTAPLAAGTISLPNASFESPATVYAYPQLDAWQQVPVWSAQQSGVFLNQPPPDPTHIDNCD